MVYHGTSITERIMVHPMDGLNETHFIELTKVADDPVFFVTCSCDEDWFYAFMMGNNSDYERIKYNIMENLFEADTMDELLETLSEIFEDGFKEILIEDKCDGDCEHCENELLN